MPTAFSVIVSRHSRLKLGFEMAHQVFEGIPNERFPRTSCFIFTDGTPDVAAHGVRDPKHGVLELNGLLFSTPSKMFLAVGTVSIIGTILFVLFGVCRIVGALSGVFCVPVFLVIFFPVCPYLFGILAFPRTFAGYTFLFVSMVISLTLFAPALSANALQTVERFLLGHEMLLCRWERLPTPRTGLCFGTNLWRILHALTVQTLAYFGALFASADMPIAHRRIFVEFRYGLYLTAIFADFHCFFYLTISLHGSQVEIRPARGWEIPFSLARLG